MELSTKEQEILKLYRADKKRKRNKLFIIIAILLLLSVGGYWLYQYVQSISPSPNEKVEQKETITDVLSPTIELTESNIEIDEGDMIDYERFIKKVWDDNDGDLSKEVIHNRIDTKKAGEYVVRYTVQDKAGNKSTATLKVIVKEKKKEETKDESKDEIVEQPVQQPVQQVPQQEQQQPSQPQPQPAPAPPVTKYFMFTDGYTMENVTSACQSELVASGRSGVCSPIQDENGIYTGMRLDLY